MQDSSERCLSVDSGIRPAQGTADGMPADRSWDCLDSSAACGTSPFASVGRPVDRAANKQCRDDCSLQPHQPRAQAQMLLVVPVCAFDRRQDADVLHASAIRRPAPDLDQARSHGHRLSPTFVLAQLASQFAKSASGCRQISTLDPRVANSEGPEGRWGHGIRTPARSPHRGPATSCSETGRTGRAA